LLAQPAVFTALVNRIFSDIYENYGTALVGPLVRPPVPQMTPRDAWGLVKKSATSTGGVS